jgi:hypothetical protein
MEVLENTKKHEEMYKRLRLKTYINTGVITTLDSFIGQLKTPPRLHPKCTDVIVYLGGSYIQMLNDGSYLFNYDSGVRKKSRKLYTVEEYMYNYLNK